MEDLQKDFVPYNFALRMKALEFDKPCFSYYMNGILQPSLNVKDYSYFKEMIEINSNIKNFENVLAPTFSQAFRWFRDEYKSFHEVFIDCEPRADVPLEDDLMFAFTIHRVREDKFIVGSRNIYKTHEEAEQACLEKLLEIVEEKQKEDGR
jgi:hypothetical protein